MGIINFHGLDCYALQGILPPSPPAKVILQQKSGVGVKPLYYHSNIPTHNSRVIYSHS